MKAIVEGLARGFSVGEVPDSDLYPETAYLDYIPSSFPQSFTYMHGYETSFKWRTIDDVRGNSKNSDRNLKNSATCVLDLRSPVIRYIILQVICNQPVLDKVNQATLLGFLTTKHFTSKHHSLFIIYRCEC
jgi:hypothetical protein